MPVDDGEFANRNLDDLVVRSEEEPGRLLRPVDSAEDEITLDRREGLVSAAAEDLEGGDVTLALGVCESSEVDDGEERALGALEIVEIMIQDSCRTIAPNKTKPKSLNPLSMDCILTAPPRKVAKHSSEVYSNMSIHDLCTSVLWIHCKIPRPATRDATPRLAKRRKVIRPGILLACHQAMMENERDSTERRCTIGFGRWERSYCSRPSRAMLGSRGSSAIEKV